MGVNPLVVVYLCITFAILFMLTRLVLGRICKAKWDAGDSLTVVAVFLSIARIALTHMIVVWKTNNVDDAFRDAHIWTAGEIEKREIGSKLTLGARCLYICLLWIQKLVLLVFYQHLVRDMPWGKPMMRVFGIVFAVTWSASIISTFVECRPIHLYWQVLPDPGNCSQAIIQLFIVGITNIFTDLMLIALPIPVILEVRLSLTKKLQLAFLFSIGFMIVIITAIRIPYTIQSRSSETVRITWTTGEFLAATFVANAPKLYSFKHLFKRRKPQPMRKFSKSGPHIRGRGEDHDLETGVTLTRIDVMQTKDEISTCESLRGEEREGSGNGEVLVLNEKASTATSPG